MPVVRKLIVIVFVLVAAAVIVYVAAGFQAPPSITITRPGEFAGATVPVELQIASATPATVHIQFEQNGTRTALPDQPAGAASITTSVGAQNAPGLKVAAGPAKII